MPAANVPKGVSGAAEQHSHRQRRAFGPTAGTPDAPTPTAFTPWRPWSYPDEGGGVGGAVAPLAVRVTSERGGVITL